DDLAHARPGRRRGRRADGLGRDTETRDGAAAELEPRDLRSGNRDNRRRGWVGRGGSAAGSHDQRGAGQQAGHGRVLHGHLCASLPVTHRGCQPGIVAVWVVSGRPGASGAADAGLRVRPTVIIKNAGSRNTWTKIRLTSPPSIVTASGCRNSRPAWVPATAGSSRN